MSFSGSLAVKCVLLNNQQCMTSPTVIDLNPVDLNNYPFMISLDKCSEICNAVDDLSTNIGFSGETKKVNVKLFNMITRIDKAKTLTKHILCDCKCIFNSTTYNLNQEWNNDKRQCGSKKYLTCQKDYSWNPSICICEISRYLKSIVDDSVTVCIEIINVTDSA